MARGRMIFWLLVLAPVWPLLIALAIKSGRIPASTFGAVGELYTRSHPMTAAWVFALGYGVVLYLVSVLLDNASIFDAHWSALPASVYVLHFALHPAASPDQARAIALTLGIWFWSLRLTGNWLKKGGLGFEDFRYVRFR